MGAPHWCTGNTQKGFFCSKNSLQTEKPVTPLTFWREMAVYVPHLALVAIAVFSIAPSEAAVERSFSAQSLLHSDLRSAVAIAYQR